MAEFPFDGPQIVLALRVLAGVGLAFWILVILDRKRWWPGEWSLHLDAAARQTRPGVLGELVIVVPARNEAATIPRTLPRLLRQHEWFQRIVVVDDRSDDRTASAAERLGQGIPGREKLQVLRVQERPDDWSGKVHAMKAGLELATRDWEGDRSKQWVLFTDADVLHPASSLGRLMSKAEDGPYDLVSVMAVLRTNSLWDWLLIPPFLYFFQMLYPFRRASDPDSRTAAAAGGCILIRRSVLEEVGGLDAIAGRRIDDLALAGLAKGSGARCWLGLDPDMQSLRVYTGLGNIVRMVTRSAFEQLGRSYLMVPVVGLALVLLFTGPAVLTITGAVLLDPFIAVPALLAWLLQAANYLPVVQYVNTPSGFAVTLPLAALAYAWMTLQSAWMHLTGRDVPWRDNIERDTTHG